jgi:LCP family protein required for cell wall assembly
VRPRGVWTWPQRLLIGFNAVLALVAVSAMAFGAVVLLRVRSIPSVDIGGNESVASPSTTAATAPQHPINVVIVGSDTRAGQDGESFGSVGGQRADVIILVRYDPLANTASMLSVPRDLWVDIRDASGAVVGEDRINTALEDGPTELVETVRGVFGVPVDHYLQINFAGFQDVVDAIGGVSLFLEGPVRDRDSRGRNRAGLDIDASGCVQLNGTQTLAYVRSRHFEQQVDGEWDPDPTGDIGRIHRQHDLARRIADQAVDRDLLNPARILELVDAARDNLVIDRGLTGDGLLTLGQQLGGIDPGTIVQHTLSVRDDTGPRGAAILRLDDATANDAALAIYRGMAPAGPVLGPVTPPGVGSSVPEASTPTC